MNTMTTKPCTRCGQVSAYEPLMFGNWDMWGKYPHYCPDCTEAIRQEEEAAEAAKLAEQRARIWEKTIPLKYRQTDQKHPDFPASMWAKLKSLQGGKSVGLIGQAGVGKTRLLALMAKVTIWKSGFVGWCPATSFQWAAQNQWDDERGDEAKRWLKRWQDAAVLCLDDLGKHRWTEAVESEFFALIDLRCSKGLPTHWTMNPLPADEKDLVGRMSDDIVGIISRALDPSGAASARPRFAPIVSRLIDETEIFPVLGNNERSR